MCGLTSVWIIEHTTKEGDGMATLLVRGKAQTAKQNLEREEERWVLGGRPTVLPILTAFALFETLSEGKDNVLQGFHLIGPASEYLI